jgi:hypothetical protein
LALDDYGEMVKAEALYEYYEDVARQKEIGRLSNDKVFSFRDRLSSHSEKAIQNAALISGGALNEPEATKRKISLVEWK